MALGRWGSLRLCNLGASPCLNSDPSWAADPSCFHLSPPTPSLRRWVSASFGSFEVDVRSCSVSERPGRLKPSLLGAWGLRALFPHPGPFFPLSPRPPPTPFAMCYGHLPLSQPLAAARLRPARGTPCPSSQTPLDPLSRASGCKNPAPVASSENCNSPGAAGAQLGPSISAPVS